MKTIRVLPALTIIVAVFWSTLTAAAIGRPADESVAPVADSSCNCPSHDVWLVSTRCLPCPRHQQSGTAGLSIAHLEDGRWSPSSQATFLQTLHPQQVLCIYVHGNRMSTSDAVQQGMWMHRQLSGTQTPLRFVIWSWPSDRIHGPVQDAQRKAARSDGESYYLACLLADLPGQQSVSLIGYSYGARTITGGLHLLARGTVCGNSLPTTAEHASVRPHAVLVAAAFPNGWISPQGTQGLALTATDHMLSLYNTHDPALKLYRFTEGNGKPIALGFRGITPRCLGPQADVLRQYNVVQSTGCSHDLERYMSAAATRNLIRQYAMWQDVP